MKSISKDDKKIRNSRQLAGFFAILSHKFDWDALNVKETYIRIPKNPEVLGLLPFLKGAGLFVKDYSEADYFLTGDLEGFVASFLFYLL